MVQYKLCKPSYEPSEWQKTSWIMNLWWTVYKCAMIGYSHTLILLWSVLCNKAMTLSKILVTIYCNGLKCIFTFSREHVLGIARLHILGLARYIGLAMLHVYVLGLARLHMLGLARLHYIKYNKCSLLLCDTYTHQYIYCEDYETCLT